MNDLQTALWITLVGMGTVFAVILLLWLTMKLLTSFATDQEPASDSPDAVPSTISRTPAERDDLAHVAVIAVAMAIAEQQLSLTHKEPATALVSAWQLGMRTRQMSEKVKQR